MKFKILCSDLDGTLLTTKSDVSDVTVSAINQIKKNTRIILVSARMPSGMTYLQERLDIVEEPIICYNGALVLDGKKVISSVMISFKILQELYALCEKFKTEIGLYVNHEWHVTQTSERVEKEIKYTHGNPTFMPASSTLAYLEKEQIGAHKLMLMGTKESSNQLIPVLNKKFKDHINIYRSNDTLIELAPKSVSKLSAIELLLKDDETIKDVIAFGDNYNDIEMLKHVGCGVAVANAREEVKAISDYTTLSNTENGVALFIQQHLVN
ncbi:MAG: Cof-type HAD-IIB family hydrolase [Maribacter sp.]